MTETSLMEESIEIPADKEAILARPLEERDDIIICENVHKWFDDFCAVRDVSLRVKRGEVVVIFGPSGSGKSTFIRMINRLEEHQSGRIVIDGIEMTNDVRNLDAIRREVGMVFQQFNLFPHMTVIGNIMLAPQRVRRIPKREAETIAMRLLERVGIPEQAGEVPCRALGRSAAAGRDRARAGHAAADHAVRRADVGARSRNDQRGAGRDARVGDDGHDHALRHPRDGLRARSGGPNGVLRRGRARRSRYASPDIPRPERAANADVLGSDPLTGWLQGRGSGAASPRR